MIVKPIKALSDNYIWAIMDSNLDTIVVDPGEAYPVQAFLKNNGLNLVSIFLTHHHADHIHGVPELLEEYPDISVYGPKDSRIPFVTHPMKQNDEINVFETSTDVLKQGVGRLKFKILDIPGHTSSHLCFYQKEYHWLFCGDTLFSAGCGRVFDGSMESLYASLKMLKDLPDETLIFCAHEYTEKNLRFAKLIEPHNQTILDYHHKLCSNPKACTLPSTIGKEKQINPFFRLESPEVVQYAAYRGLAKLDPLSVFSQLRRDKDGF